MNSMHAIPIVGTCDVEQTANALRDLLGFDIAEVHRPGSEAVYAICRRDGGEIHVQIRRPAVYPRGFYPADRESHETEVYVLVDDVDALYDEVKDQVDIVHPLRDEPYGMRDFTCGLPGGARVAFAAPLASRVDGVD